ncbi:nitrogen regulation protein NR(II) [Salinisphaera sp. G21_0]|nr:nitrogen regulation protein NR(II) [Salinisphaera sp. G21_0]
MKQLLPGSLEEIIPETGTMQNIILDNLNTVVMVLDREFRVITLNPAAETLLDTSLKRILNQSVTTVIPEENFKADLDRSLSQYQQFTRRETDFPINGEMINVDYSISPITCGEARLLLEINPRDRVQKITREESLIAKQETSRILVRGLAHEVKNPLGGIRGAAQLLARELDDQGLKEFTGIIIQEADRLRDLVDQMLGPLQPPKMEDLNIHEVLERVMQLINAETGGELRLKRDYDPSIPDIPGDFERMIQAILNLVRNAMQAIDQAMPRSEGLITLRTRIARQFTIGTQRRRLVCHLSIIDNGPGIPPDLIDNIFYPMISGRADGTGLGLPMAQSIISLHQGLVECESKPGETIFNVFLPITREPLSLDMTQE